MKQRKSKSRENGDDSSVADHANGNEELQQRDEDTKKREKKKKKQQQLRKEDQDEEEKFEKKEKKKKLMKEEEENDDDEGNRTIKTKEKKKPKKGEGGAGEVEAVKRWMATVSIAVAGSIVDNAQSFELATRLAGQIARAATIFRVDEVIIFDNKVSSADDSGVAESEDAGDSESGAPFLVRILQYLETPQYLRRSLFPINNSLRFVGMLPPLDAPHHLRRHEWAPYREGPGQRLQEYLKPLDLDYPIVRHARVTLKGKPSNSTGTFVDVGLNKNVIVEGVLEPGKRVTVAMGTNRQLETDYLRKVVPSSKPREELGQYWGYKVRYASNISQIFSGCPHEGGYDYTIGTSEHGHIISSSELAIPTFRHLLIAFGGLGGLEENIEEDCDLKGKDVQKVFDAYLNICPHQGSRTIRTEEAIFIALQYFQEPIERSTHRFKPTVLKTKGIGYSHQGHLQVAPSVK